MLLELSVENYAVVERLRVHFHSGLNLLTGETGSGKSIVVDALGLLLGARASADMVRTGEARARVAGIFDIPEPAALRRLLEPAGLEIEDGELLIEREILASGKSRAFVGSRPVSVALLKELAPLLADIHGQHDQQLLFSPDAQRAMLDASGGYGDLLDRAAGLYGQWRAAAAELEELEGSEQEKLRLLDLWQFQRKEIESASLGAEEDATLENERRVLQNVQRIEEAAGAAYSAVYEGEDSALRLTRAALKRLDELCRIDGSLEPLREHLKSADLSLQEASYGLRDYLSRLEANPDRLEEVESRLEAIARLKRKYGQSIVEVLSFLDDVRRQIASVE
ncbi:MAG: AAA family ATPase, partial [Bryobacteraceae bacterium]